MEPLTFILMGRSGCGKGTQAKLLKEYIEAHDSSKRSLFYLETGARFREFIQGKSFSSRLAAEINKTGGLQPAFLAVWNWAHLLVDEMTGEEHLIVDGMPRSYQEALVFDTAMTFYGRVKPVLIYLDVSRQWAKEKLVGRGRSDDRTSVEIDRKLNWFESDVLPAVDFFRDNPKYHFIHIDGEQTIEKVHEDVMGGVKIG